MQRYYRWYISIFEPSHCQVPKRLKGVSVTLRRWQLTDYPPSNNVARGTFTVLTPCGLPSTMFGTLPSRTCHRGHCQRGHCQCETLYTLRLHCRLRSLRHLSVRPLLAFGRLVFTLPCLLPQLWTPGVGVNNFSQCFSLSLSTRVC